MRAFLFLIGVLVMSEAFSAPSQPPGSPMPPPFPGTEKLSVRKWDARGKQFLRPVENLDAYRRTDPDTGTLVIVVKNCFGHNGQPKALSELICTDGTYVVTKAMGGGGSPETFCEVVKKKSP